MPRHDVAIYAPWAGLFYDRSAGRGGGGAERQTWLLAHSLARRGLRVAHIVYPVADPQVDPGAPVTLIQRRHPDAPGRTRSLASETIEVWRALSEADAAVVVLRGAAGTLGAAGAWCKAHRRRLLFAGANNADFTLENFGARDPRAAMFRAGLRMTDAVVVQSSDQVKLAREGFVHLDHVEEIASFVEAAPETTGEPEAFLWVSRLTSYKRPLLYADLAAAVPKAHFWMIATKTDDPDFEPTLDELRRRAVQTPNLELLDQRTHPELQQLINRSVAMVNTSTLEGMPNTFLEGWARGVPALTLSFDPDGRIQRRGLGIAAGGSWEDFTAGARELWAHRSDRNGFGPAVRDYIAEEHGTRVENRWEALLTGLARSR